MLTGLKHSVAYVAYKEQRKALLRWLKLPQYRGDAHCCPVCGTHLRAFKPIWKSFHRKIQEHEYIYPLSSIETLTSRPFMPGVRRLRSRTALCALS